MASKKKNKNFDFYWTALFAVVIVVLIGALFIGKYLGDKFVKGGNTSQSESLIKTMAKPTISPVNSDFASQENGSQVILPPSFNVKTNYKTSSYSSSSYDKKNTSDTKTDNVAVKKGDNKDTDTEDTGDVNQNNTSSLPVPDNSTAKTDSDLSQMVNQPNKDNSVENQGFDKVEIGDENSENNGYKVQTGVYENRKNADKMVEDLTNSGYDATVIRTDKDDKTYYRVQTGSFENKENAENLKNDLKQNKIDSTIVNH